jgi:hypothetical protein
MKAAELHQLRVIEFTVAPMVHQGAGKSYHEWFIEFDQLPQDMEAFRLQLDQNMRNKNIYYDDLITGSILQPLVITPIQKNGFIDYMKSIGKLGGQNKVPRLSNDRNLADALSSYYLKL